MNGRGLYRAYSGLLLRRTTAYANYGSNFSFAEPKQKEPDKCLTLFV